MRFNNYRCARRDHLLRSLIHDLSDFNSLPSDLIKNIKIGSPAENRLSLRVENSLIPVRQLQDILDDRNVPSVRLSQRRMAFDHPNQFRYSDDSRYKKDWKHFGKTVQQISEPDQENSDDKNYHWKKRNIVLLRNERRECEEQRTIKARDEQKKEPSKCPARIFVFLRQPETTDNHRDK